MGASSSLSATEENSVAVQRTGDNLGHPGTGWGGGVRLAVGLLRAAAAHVQSQ